MKFTKMHGAGNDFILINGIGNRFLKNRNIEEFTKNICDRHFGVGADGLMYSEESKIADIKMNYYNSDGSIAKLCGNGIRCFTKFVLDEGLIMKNEFYIETLAGVKTVRYEDTRNIVTVNIGSPLFDSKKIPIISEENDNIDKLVENVLNINGKNLRIYSLSIGVPHTVIFVKSLNDTDVESIGKEIENHKLFPDGTNVNFVRIIGRDEVEVISWERGAGRTLSCGTGACAVAVTGFKKNKTASKIKTIFDGGVLEVAINPEGEILLTGNAIAVFKGNY